MGDEYALETVGKETLKMQRSEDNTDESGAQRTKIAHGKR